jgi:hypothetical protein
VEGVNCSFIAQLPSCFCSKGVERHDVVVDQLIFHFEMLQLLVGIFFLCGVGEGIGKGGFKFCPQGSVTSWCGPYFNLQVVELFIDPVINLGPPDK